MLVGGKSTEKKVKVFFYPIPLVQSSIHTGDLFPREKTTVTASSYRSAPAAYVRTKVYCKAATRDEFAMDRQKKNSYIALRGRRKGVRQKVELAVYNHTCPTSNHIILRVMTVSGTGEGSHK